MKTYAAPEDARDCKEKGMKLMLIVASALIIGLMIFFNAHAFRSPDDVARMSVEELKQQLENPNLMIIDVRTADDWNSSTMKIKGSIREDPSEATTWMAKVPPRKILVFYCA